MELILSTSFWFIFLCIAAGFTYAFILYRNEHRFDETMRWLKKAMFIFRFLAVTIIAFFLLSPFIKTSFREIEKPSIVIAVDNSQSVKINFQNTSAETISKSVQALKENLAGKFDVKTLSFGENVKDANVFSFDEKLTDISGLFDEIKTRYSGRNLGSVILIGDGIYNAGSNPVYKALDIKAPVFTVALGDTTIKKDIILSRVEHNKVAYLGNTFPLQIVMDAKQAGGENTLLTVKEDSNLIFTRNISFSGSAYHLTVPVYANAKQKGIHRYKINLSSLAGEQNLLNNSADIFIEVLESKQKILLIANAPHPDIAAIKSSIEKNINYELKTVYANSFNENIAGFNLVILHQLPSNIAASTQILERIKTSAVPVFFILGGQTNVNAFNNLQTGINISQPLNKVNETLPLSVEAFSLFTIAPEILKTVNSFPPLYSPFGTYKQTGEIYTLLKQRIGSVETEQPLLYFKETNEARAAVLTGEGIWKWKLREVADKNSSASCDELISKIVQYLVLKDKRTPFRVQYKSNLTENEPLIFDAELYNSTGEIVNEPEVNITITNSEGKEYRYTFSRTEKTYHLNAGNFTVGYYKFKAETKLADKIYSERGEFSVSSLMVENVETTANHQLLYALASRTGGEMVSINETQKLVDLISKDEKIKPVSYYHKKLSELISIKWMFGLIMLLLCAEWFLRKRSGAY